jgi:hypothetical protein
MGRRKKGPSPPVQRFPLMHHRKNNDMLRPPLPSEAHRLSDVVFAVADPSQLKSSLNVACPACLQTDFRWFVGD